jgi:release factor glutamine methyltransferase
MKLKDIKEYFLNSLHHYYSEEEIETIFFIILEDIFNIDKTQYVVLSELDNDFDFVKILEIIERLKKLEPVQHITGFAIFSNRKFFVNKHTLIPRPETEELTMKILNEHKNSKNLKILDIGTGSGCIAITLALELENPEVFGIDKNSGTIEIAKKNAELHNVKVNFMVKDIFTPGIFENHKFDIIVSNPPYISDKEKDAVAKNVFNHEPYNALFAPGEEPLIFYERISFIAEHSLKKGGFIYLEINHNFASQIKDIFSKFDLVTVSKDIFGKNRFVIVRK